MTRVLVAETAPLTSNGARPVNCARLVVSGSASLARVDVRDGDRVVDAVCGEVVSVTVLPASVGVPPIVRPWMS